MAWIATEDFTGYTVGATIAGDSGGTNWTGNWAVAAGTITTETAPSGMTGVAARINSTSGNNSATRDVTAVTIGQIQFDLLSSVTNANSDEGVALRDNTGSTNAQIYFQSGNLNLNGNSGTQVLVTTFAANTVYTVVVDIDRANNRYRAKVNGGAYTSYVTEFTNSDFSRLYFSSFSTNAHATWLDNIKPEPPAILTASVSDSLTNTESSPNSGIVFSADLERPIWGVRRF